MNEFGIEQAKVLKEQLQDIEFDLVFSSPQERASRTAQIVTGGKVVLNDRLDVFDLGDADRLPISEVQMAGSIPDFFFL